MDLQYSETLIIKIPKEMKEKIIQKSKEQCNPISAYVRDIIMQELNKDTNK